MLAAATTGPPDQFWKSAIPVIPPRSRSYQLHTGRPSFKCAQPALLHLPAVHESLRRRRFRSTLDTLVRDSSACHERRGKRRRTRMSIVRLLSSTAPTLRHLSCAASGDGQECPSSIRSLCGNRRETDTAKICQRLHDKVGDLSQFFVSGFSAVPCS